MGKRADWRLDASLNAYATTVRASARVNALKRSAEKWPVYAAVTGAALAMASNASASIIYSGVINETASLASGEHFANSRFTEVFNRKAIALGNATGASFNVDIEDIHSSNIFGDVFLSGNGAMKFSAVSNGEFIKRLSSGAKISGGSQDVFRISGADLAFTNNGHQPGGWSRTEGFAGFDFSTINKQQKDFGWVRLQYSLGNDVKVIDWAYDNTGAAILTGDEGVGSTPEPSTMALMLLAAGAAGVEVLRRRREVAQQVR